jgi:hypothetical protein
MLPGIYAGSVSNLTQAEDFAPRKRPRIDNVSRCKDSTSCGFFTTFDGMCGRGRQGPLSVSHPFAVTCDENAGGKVPTARRLQIGIGSTAEVFRLVTSVSACTLFS